MQRWIWLIEEFGTKFQYLLGPENVVADALSLYLYGTALPLMIEQVLLDSMRDQSVSLEDKQLPICCL
jgi:hypothetical protein